MVLEEKVVGSEELQEQAARILRSEQFRSSEVLRRLLSFLMEKALAGEADNLKEYIVAIDGLGKPPSYDPQHNSAVRIQMGRLRQRLAEYYREAGQDDPILIDLPKGRFRLTFEQRDADVLPHEGETVPRSSLSAVPPPPAIAVPFESPRHILRWLGFGFLAAVAILAAGYAMGHYEGARQNAGAGPGKELEALWAPFLATKFPLIVSIEDPLFAEMRSNPGVYVRDRSMNEWSDMESSPALKGLRAALKQPEIRPSRYYTAFGEAESSFLLGSLFRNHDHPVSVTRTSQISWQQLANNNVVFVGVQNLFFNQLRNLPIAPQLVPELNGVRDENPASGQQSFYADQYLTAPSEEGKIYALVTHLPGPNGKNDIESFTSNRSAGYLGAVQNFTDPQFARMLESEMKSATGGRIPQYYQVLFQVSYRDSVPTEVKLVLWREMH